MLTSSQAKDIGVEVSVGTTCQRAEGLLSIVITLPWYAGSGGAWCLETCLPMTHFQWVAPTQCVAMQHWPMLRLSAPHTVGPCGFECQFCVRSQAGVAACMSRLVLLSVCDVILFLDTAPRLPLALMVPHALLTTS
ncbi:hypothetical protein HaLaN_31251 [Haematococcus lacustris]|uniref:Uncharacterized protein n=1 Tax=Haematococcus lacustris TaxID=44745 RepID=A0A6A0AGK7_HAELA|nr:hypothetical protein HaLaN_31251 [Haematococcus lacustris]